MFYCLWARYRMLPSDAKAVVSSISSTAAGEGPEKKKRLGLKDVIFHPKYSWTAANSCYSSAIQCSNQDGEALVKTYKATVDKVPWNLWPQRSQVVSHLRTSRRVSGGTGYSLVDAPWTSEVQLSCFHMSGWRTSSHIEPYPTSKMWSIHPEKAIRLKVLQ